MKKIRKDSRGRVLHRGESYIKKKQLFCYAYTDVLGKRKYVYAKDLPELREKEAEIERYRVEGLSSYPVARVDVNYVFDKYFANKTRLSSTTKSKYAYAYDHYVRNGFGKNKVTDVRFSDVLTYYNGLMRNGLKIASVAAIHQLVNAAFALAVRDNVIKSNPCTGAITEIKKLTGKPEHKKALTLEAQRTFLKELENPEYSSYKNFFIVMFGTGVRVGELIGLRWCDVDFEKAEISINHNITYYRRLESKGRVEFKVSLPKTPAGIRTIPMLDKVKEALLNEKEEQERTGHSSIVELDGMKGFIFCNKYRLLYNHHSLDRFIWKVVDGYNFKEIQKANEEDREPVLLPRFSCHIARHSFCTRLCEHVTDYKVVQSTMGHKNIQTTLDVYADASERKNKKIFKLLNDNMIF